MLHPHLHLALQRILRRERFLCVCVCHHPKGVWGGYCKPVGGQNTSCSRCTEAGWSTRKGHVKSLSCFMLSHPSSMCLLEHSGWPALLASWSTCLVENVCMPQFPARLVGPWVQYGQSAKPLMPLIWLTSFCTEQPWEAPWRGLLWRGDCVFYSDAWGSLCFSSLQ